MKKIYFSLTIIIFIFFNLKAQPITDWGFAPLTFEDSNTSFGSTYGDVFAPSENEVFVIRYGYVYKSTDGGYNWNSYNTQIEENFFDLKFKDSTTGYAVGDNGTLIKTTDGGSSWMQVNLNTTQALLAISILPNGNVWAVGESGIVVTSNDNGVTWQENTMANSEFLIDVVFKNNNEGFISGKNGLLLHTLDAGQSWQTIDTPIAEDIFNLMVKDNKLYFLSNQYVNIQTDPNYFYLTSYSSELHYTSDLIDFPNFLNNSPVSVTSIYIQNNDLYTFGGDYYLCNCCGIFIAKNNLLDDTATTMYDKMLYGDDCQFNMEYSKTFVLNETTGYAISGNDLMLIDPTGDFSTQNFKKLDLEVYPNPIKNGYFTITSKSIDLSQTEMKLFDIQGKSVKSFTGISNNQKIDVSNLGSGIYFLQLRIEGNLATKKIIIN